MHVVQVCIAYRGSLVPDEHRIDRFRKLRAASLVNTARIYPDVLIAIDPGLLAAPPDLIIFLLGTLPVSLVNDIVEKNFILAPSV